MATENKIQYYTDGNDIWKRDESGLSILYDNGEWVSSGLEHHEFFPDESISEEMAKQKFPHGFKNEEN